MISVAVAAGAVVGVLGAALGWLLTRGFAWRYQSIAVASGFGISALGASSVAPPVADAELAAAAPVFLHEDGFETSTSCRGCHPGQYESWHQTYHRTMTQLAGPESVVAPFDGRILRERGRAFAVLQSEGMFYVAEVGGDRNEPLQGTGAWRDACERVWRVVMTTGSHHLQAFWVQADSGRLEQFPFVYLIEHGRWLANSDSFLQPEPDDADPLRRFIWADDCVTCHTTGGPWDASEARPSAAVAELGIACEACHGVAESHTAANRWPARRYQLHARSADADGVDETIVSPHALDAERASSICARCHAVHPESDEGLRGLENYVPGERLAEYTDVTRLFELVERARGAPSLEPFTQPEREDISAFWDDGTVRVAGREFSGMVRSGCYQQGAMSCLSCHSLHEGRRARQMDRAKLGDAMCVGCHEPIARDVESHTHHPVQSTGSRCVECHMPYVSYGLMSGTRSHRMDGPTATGLSSRSRPNACNLCHLDRPLGWVAERLNAWYGQPIPDLPPEHRELPAGAVWMLSGDAAQRGIAAWNVSTPAAREAAEIEVLLPALAELFTDPYSAVRQLASHSALTADPDASIDVEALTRAADPAARGAFSERWAPRPELSAARIRALSASRDDTPTWVSE